MAIKEDDKIPGVPEAPHSKAKNGGKDVKDQLGPFVPNQREYYAGIALGGIMANAALHRSPNAAALAVKAGADMVVELAKPPAPSDEELTERARVENEIKAKQQREQRAAEEEAQAKVAKEREEEEAKEREKLEKAEREQRDKLEKQVARELEKPGTRNEREPARPM